MCRSTTTAAAKATKEEEEENAETHKDQRALVCSLGSLCFQARKGTDLQSAEGHKDAAHTCDDVKVKGGEIALTKSRAAAAH